MAKKRKNKKLAKTEEYKPKRKFLTIFICIFVALVVVLGAALGIISSIKKSKALVSFKGVIMSEEVASYFVTRYKYEYMSELRRAGANPNDSYAFWNKDAGNGKSYGEILEARTRNYVAQILICNYLFDKYGNLTAEERDLISDEVEAYLNNQADGSKATFNDKAAKMGFSYSSFKEATEMYYKYLAAATIFCGANGENMKNQPELVKESISEYSHVKLLFIRTETTYVLDDKGNRVTEPGGAYKMRDLTDEEKAGRALLISRIDSQIDAFNSTQDNAMSDVAFENYLKNNDEGDPSMHSSGYYFREGTGFSEAFEKDYPTITEKVYELTVGKYGKAELDFGVCYIYKYEPSVNDLEVDALEECFSDFYTNLALKFFVNTLDEYMPDVSFKDSFNEINVLDVPCNQDLRPFK